MATAFSAPTKRLVVPTMGTTVLAVLGAPVLVAALPFLGVSLKMVKAEPGEGAAKYWAKFAVMHIFYAGFLLAGAFVGLAPIAGARFTGFHALALYLPSLVIGQHDRSQQYGFAGTIIMRCFFDTPLVAAGYVAREVFRVHLFAPFASILDETIV